MMPYTILPTPKTLLLKEGAFSLDGACLYLQEGLEPRVVTKAAQLRRLLTQKTGQPHPLMRGDAHGGIAIALDERMKKESYTLDVDAEGIRLVGGDAAGCFYGITTLMQMLNVQGNALPAVSIQDRPDMGYRGFYFDATRGRVPSVEGAKTLIRRLADYKVNVLQFYVEHTYEFREFLADHRTEEDYLTAEDILEIDRYCYEHFIDFQPSLSTFGHLYELLSRERYQHLCELENYIDQNHFWQERMEHHTIDPSNPESWQVVCSLIDQYLPLFRSDYFNICCDETFDLCRGRNQGKDTAETYVNFVEKIIRHVTACGKKVMMWSDIALKYPHILSRLPDDTIILNWDYSATPNTDTIRQIGALNIPQIVCPGTQSWTTFIEQPSVAVPNILTMAKCGYDHGALGVLNTNWGDYGHTTHPECSMYGTVLGACVAWRIATEADEAFDTAVNATLYRSQKDVAALIRQLEACHSTASWAQCYRWVQTQNPAVFESDPTAIEASIAVAVAVADRLRRATGETDLLTALANTADVIALMNRAALEVKTTGHTSALWQQDLERWFEGYTACWRQSSKASEIAEILRFMKRM